MSQLSKDFKNRNYPRYWWHKFHENNFEPDIYRLLTHAQRRVIKKWFLTTDRDHSSGEINVSAIGIICSLINSSKVKNVVELGRWTGYSTFFIGLTLKRMGKIRGQDRTLFSFDIREDLTNFSEKYLRKLKLLGQVKLYLADSGGEISTQLYKNAASGKIDVLLIDTDHTHKQAMRDLSNWYELVAPSGFIVLHDSSIWATKLGSTPDAGVRIAINEFFLNKGDSILRINDFSENHPDMTSVYPDGCGLTIIQKTM